MGRDKKEILNYENFLKENEVYSATDMIRYITDITKDSDSDIPDYYFDIIKKTKAKFVRKVINIEDQMKKDPALKEYIDSKEDRYDGSDNQPNEDDLDLPIVIYNGEVIDGYNRTSTTYKNGEKTIVAYVSI